MKSQICLPLVELTTLKNEKQADIKCKWQDTTRQNKENTRLDQRRKTPKIILRVTWSTKQCGRKERHKGIYTMLGDSDAKKTNYVALWRALTKNNRRIESALTQATGDFRRNLTTRTGLAPTTFLVAGWASQRC